MKRERRRVKRQLHPNALCTQTRNGVPARIIIGNGQLDKAWERDTTCHANRLYAKAQIHNVVASQRHDSVAPSAVAALYAPTITITGAL